MPAANDTIESLDGWCHHPRCAVAARALLATADDATTADAELLQRAQDAIATLGAPCLDGSAHADGARLYLALLTERVRALHARQRFQARNQRLARLQEQRDARRRNRAARPTQPPPPISKDEVLAAVARARAKRRAQDGTA